MKNKYLSEIKTLFCVYSFDLCFNRLTHILISIFIIFSFRIAKVYLKYIMISYTRFSLFDEQSIKNEKRGREEWKTMVHSI